MYDSIHIQLYNYLLTHLTFATPTPQEQYSTLNITALRPYRCSRIDITDKKGFIKRGHRLIAMICYDGTVTFNDTILTPSNGQLSHQQLAAIGAHVTAQVQALDSKSYGSLVAISTGFAQKNARVAHFF
jgi:hypothetical protein